MADLKTVDLGLGVSLTRAENPRSVVKLQGAGNHAVLYLDQARALMAALVELDEMGLLEDDSK